MFQRVLLAAGLALATAVSLGPTIQAQTATVTSVTSPGPLSLTVGTTAPMPVVVGQAVRIGLAFTNTSTAPIGPFTYGAQVGSTAKLDAIFSGNNTCQKAGGSSFSCTFSGRLQPGLMDNATSFSIIPQSAGTIDITALIQPTAGSSAPSNSAHLVLTAVAPSYDLQLTQSASSGQPAAGGSLTHTFQVKNTGPQAATGTTLTDTLPGDARALGATASNGGACGVTGQTISCSLGSVAAGTSINVTVSALAPTLLGSYTNTGTVAATGPDANPANNTASTTIQIR